MGDALEYTIFTRQTVFTLQQSPARSELTCDVYLSTLAVFIKRSLTFF